MVSVIEDVLRLRLAEQRPDALRSGVVAWTLRCAEPTGRQCCVESSELAGFELPGPRMWKACTAGEFAGRDQ